MRSQRKLYEMFGSPSCVALYLKSYFLAVPFVQ